MVLNMRQKRINAPLPFTFARLYQRTRRADKHSATLLNSQRSAYMQIHMYTFTCKIVYLYSLVGFSFILFLNFFKGRHIKNIEVFLIR